MQAFTSAHGPAVSRTLPVRGAALALLAAGAVLFATATARAGQLAAYLATQDAPLLALDERARATHVVELPVGRVMTTDAVDRFCGKPGIKLMPLARIRVERAVNWYISTDEPEVELYLIQGDACYEKLQAVELPRGGELGLWARVPGTYKKPLARLRVTIHGPLQSAPIAIELGDDLTTAVTKAIEVPPGDFVENPLTIKSSVRREVRVHVFGRAKQLGFGARDQPRLDRSFDGTVRPDAPLTFSLYASGNAKVTLVVTDGKTIATERDVYLKPEPNSGVLERALVRSSILTTGKSKVSPESADLAGRLFTTLDPVFFVYGIAERPRCGLHVGEPVLLLDDSTLMHANGDVEACLFDEDDRASDYLSPRRPAKLTWPAVIEAATDEHQTLWSPEVFLGQAGADKQIAAYAKAKDAATRCYDREWARLDPDHHASQYDVVTYAGGQVTKVESYGARIYRRVAAACHIDALSRQRDAIYARQRKTFAADETRRLDAIAKRFAAEAGR